MKARHHDFIMVVMHKLNKTTHFILVKSTHKETDIAHVFMREISKLHGLPKAIISYRDIKLTSNF